MKNINTKVIKVDTLNLKDNIIEEGARVIREGGLVAFPTETVYGLGANGLDPIAVARIFQAKGRPQDNPLILHVHAMEQVKDLVEYIPKYGEELMKAFWPGPLTLLFKKNHKLPEIITAGLDTVAIRMPHNPIALGLIKASGVPIAAPSANTSGKPSPTMARHVEEDLGGKVDMIIDGGTTGVGLESTVLDLMGELPTILRPGAISLEDLRMFIPNVEEDLAISRDDSNRAPRSPGQKYRHYAPKAKMILFTGEINAMVEDISRHSAELMEQGKKVGIMATDETMDIYNRGMVISLGSRKNMEIIAHNLFNTLRLLDSKKVDIILCEGMEMSGIGAAIMNRLKKASSGNIRIV